MYKTYSIACSNRVDINIVDQDEIYSYSFIWEPAGIVLMITGNVIKSLANIEEVETILNEFPQEDYTMYELIRILKWHGFEQQIDEIQESTGGMPMVREIVELYEKSLECLIGKEYVYE